MHETTTPAADLREASTGFTCQGCGRAEHECSANPCHAVQADREEAETPLVAYWSRLNAAITRGGYGDPALFGEARSMFTRFPSDPETAARVLFKEGRASPGAPAHASADDFAAVLDAWQAAKGFAAVEETRAQLDAITPPGVCLRPNASALAVNVSLSGSYSSALLYLNAYGSRKRDPGQVRLAWAAILAISAANTSTAAAADA